METVENLVEQFPLAAAVSELNWMERETIFMFQISAKKYRFELTSILEEE
jgi:hypothetical protein